MANFGFARSPSSLPTSRTGARRSPPIGASRPPPKREKNGVPRRRCSRLHSGRGHCHLRSSQARAAVIPLPEPAPLIEKELARGGRIALVFGPEKRGLTRRMISRICHILTVIPTDPQQPSMNLGQAVAVCLYELSARLASFSMDRVPMIPRIRGPGMPHDSTILPHPRAIWISSPRRRTNNARGQLLARRNAKGKPARSRSPSPQARPDPPRRGPHSRILPPNSLAAESLNLVRTIFLASSTSWLPPAKFHGEPSKIPAKVAFKGPHVPSNSPSPPLQVCSITGASLRARIERGNGCRIGFIRPHSGHGPATRCQPIFAIDSGARARPPTRRANSRSIFVVNSCSLAGFSASRSSAYRATSCQPIPANPARACVCSRASCRTSRDPVRSSRRKSACTRTGADTRGFTVGTGGFAESSVFRAE